ncbi:DUF262 domain-containing protein [Microbacterium sp. NPDC056044]|uniref:DUF262 domain-containing protein n=1 Tax=Microbacterium sp. NPDC056044 TaxID=3345690 RepID=UPI0035D621D8
MTEPAESDVVDEIPDESPEDEIRDDDSLSTSDLADLVLYTLDWSVQSLLERIGTTFDIAPTFQRRDAWSIDRKSLYIESLLLGLPVPQIVLAEDKERKGRFIVLDGKQRLVTLKQFASPDESFRPFRLKNLEFATELEGLSFDDIATSLLHQAQTENFLAQPVRTIVVRNWKNPAVLYQVFLRLNQGSLSLSPQELRQALYPSDFTKWINVRSAASREIQRARRIKREDFRMRDAEMLLRYTAFFENIEGYRGNLRGFLDEACVSGARRWADDGEAYFETVADRCEMAIRRTFDAFTEKDSFLRYEHDGYIRRFNIAVFDMMTAVLGDVTLADADFAAHTSEIREAYESLCIEDRMFNESLVTTTKTREATGGRIIAFGSEVARIVGHDLEIVDRARTMLRAE